VDRKGQRRRFNSLITEPSLVEPSINATSYHECSIAVLLHGNSTAVEQNGGGSSDTIKQKEGAKLHNTRGNSSKKVQAGSKGR